MIQSSEVTAMICDMRGIEPAEINYLYSQSSQISMQSGLIGYVRADMGSNGLGFYSTWNEFDGRFNTDEFKEDLNKVINDHRAGHNFLSNREALSQFCLRNADLSITDDMRNFGVRMDTDRYSYLMRLNPHKGEYNLYCYCYIRDWLDKHLDNATKGIRFIDARYNEKFRIPDGGKIRIRLSDGSSVERTCRYIDDYHMEVGNSLYHICEFAERMEGNGNQVEPVERAAKPKERPKSKDKER